VRTYRTEIFVPADRSVLIQLPDDVPQGWASITVEVEEHDPADSVADLFDADRQDIEWFDLPGLDQEDDAALTDDPRLAAIED
jgi:hypothetical protein